MINKTDQRKTPVASDKELYKNRSSNIKTLITKERRKDELDRLIEVQQQKKVWKRTVVTSGLIILGLIVLAYLGWVENV